MRRIHLYLILASVILVLSMASFFVVFQGAIDEPYGVFRKYDAIVQIGVAMVLMLLWSEVAIAIIAGVIGRYISVWWLSLLFWVGICEFYLAYSPIGYVNDIVRNAAVSP